MEWVELRKIQYTEFQPNTEIIDYEMGIHETIRKVVAYVQFHFC